MGHSGSAAKKTAPLKINTRWKFPCKRWKIISGFWTEGRRNKRREQKLHRNDKVTIGQKHVTNEHWTTFCKSNRNGLSSLEKKFLNTALNNMSHLTKTMRFHTVFRIPRTLDGDHVFGDGSALLKKSGITTPRRALGCFGEAQCALFRHEQAKSNGT